MRIKGLAGLVALAGLALGVWSAWAVTPRFWEDFTQGELLSGKLDGVALAPDGALSLAPAYDALFDTEQPYVFSLVRDKRGRLYAGTGGEGKVFAIDPAKEGGERGRLYFKAAESNVFALALDGADALYVATSPDGKIYKATGEGQSAVFCDLQVKYVWALAFDEDGNLYAGTGGAGVVYKIDRGGNKSVFYSSGDAHVRSLAWRGRNLLAGTSPGGKVVEITPEGKGFTLADTPLEEINALAVGRDGVVFAAASSSASGGAATSAAAPPRAPSSTVVVEVVASGAVPSRPAAAASPSVPAATPRQDAAAKSTVYAIGRDGNVEAVSSPDQAVYDVAVRPGGALLLATGAKGRLLELDAEGRATFLADSPEESAVRLVPADDEGGDGFYVATSNQGKVYRLRAQAAQTGTYESDVLDAGTVASWGRITWRWSGGGDVAVSTRVGNTEEPDGSWSAWSEGHAASGAALGHPRARYLQWRAVLRGAGRLDRVGVSYLQQNVRPRITALAQLPAGIELQAQPSMAGSMGFVSVSSGGRSLLAPRERGRDTMPTDPRQVLTPGVQSFTWRAEDENEDALEYAVYFKREDEAGDGAWKPLAQNLKDAFYTLNTAALPDGAYRLKVAVSDEPSNPPETALAEEKTSKPFTVVSSTPRVEVISSAVEGGRAAVRFRAGVASGAVASAEYSVDGAAWRLVFPDDGVADSAAEEYSFTTPELAPGEHLVGVRASDRGGATGTAAVAVRVP